MTLTSLLREGYQKVLDTKQKLNHNIGFEKITIANSDINRGTFLDLPHNTTMPLKPGTCSLMLYNNIIKNLIINSNLRVNIQTYYTLLDFMNLTKTAFMIFDNGKLLDPSLVRLYITSERLTVLLIDKDVSNVEIIIHKNSYLVSKYNVNTSISLDNKYINSYFTFTDGYIDYVAPSTGSILSTGAIHTVSISPDGTKMLIGGEFLGYAKLYSISGDAVTFISDVYSDNSKTALNSYVESVAWCNNSDKFAVGGSFTGKAKWYSITGSTVTFMGNISTDGTGDGLLGTVYSLAFSHDGANLLLGGNTSVGCKLYAVSESAISFISNVYMDNNSTAFSDYVTSMRFTPDDTKFIIGGYFTAKAKLYSINENNVSYLSNVPYDTVGSTITGNVEDVEISADGTKIILSGGLTGRCRLYTMSGTTITYVTNFSSFNMDAYIYYARFSPDGTKIITGGGFNDRAKLFTISGTTITFIRNIYADNGTALLMDRPRVAAFTPNGDNFIIGGGLVQNSFAKFYSVTGTNVMYLDNVYMNSFSGSFNITLNAQGKTMVLYVSDFIKCYNVTPKSNSKYNYVQFPTEIPFMNTDYIYLFKKNATGYTKPVGYTQLCDGYKTTDTANYVALCFYRKDVSEYNDLRHHYDLYQDYMAQYLAGTLPTSIDTFIPYVPDIPVDISFADLKSKVFTAVKDIPGFYRTFLERTYKNGRTNLAITPIIPAFTRNSTAIDPIVTNGITYPVDSERFSPNVGSLGGGIYFDSQINNIMQDPLFKLGVSTELSSTKWSIPNQSPSVIEDHVIDENALYIKSFTIGNTDRLISPLTTIDKTVNNCIQYEMKKVSGNYSFIGTGDFVGDIFRLNNSVLGATFSADGGKFIIGGAFTGNCKLYTIADNITTYIRDISVGGNVASVAFSPDGTKLLIGGYFPGVCKLYTVSGTTITYVTDIKSDNANTSLISSVTSISWHPDGTRFLIGGGFSGYAKLYSISGNTVTFISNVYANAAMNALSNTVNCVRFAPDGNSFIVSGLFAGFAKIYSLSGTTITYVDDLKANSSSAITATVNNVCYSPDGSKLIIGGSFAGYCKLYTVSGTSITYVADIKADNSGTFLNTFVNMISFSADGSKFIVGGGFTGYGRLYTISGTTVTFVDTLKGDSSGGAISATVSTLGFSPVGDYMYIGGGFTNYFKMYSVSGTIPSLLKSINLTQYITSTDNLYDGYIRYNYSIQANIFNGSGNSGYFKLISENSSAYRQNEFFFRKPQLTATKDQYAFYPGTHATEKLKVSGMYKILKQMESAGTISMWVLTNSFAALNTYIEIPTTNAFLAIRSYADGSAEFVCDGNSTSDLFTYKTAANIMRKSGAYLLSLTWSGKSATAYVNSIKVGTITLTKNISFKDADIFIGGSDKYLASSTFNESPANAILLSLRMKLATDSEFEIQHLASSFEKLMVEDESCVYVMNFDQGVDTHPGINHPVSYISKSNPKNLLFFNGGLNLTPSKIIKTPDKTYQMYFRNTDIKSSGITILDIGMQFDPYYNGHKMTNLSFIEGPSNKIAENQNMHGFTTGIDIVSPNVSTQQFTSCTDSDGYLYTGASNGVIRKYNPVDLSIMITGPDSYGSLITGMVVDSDGYLYVAGFNNSKIFKYDRETLTKISESGTIGNGVNFGLASDMNGNLYTISTKKAYKVKRDTFQILLSSADFPGTIGSMALESGMNSLYIGGGEGSNIVWRLDTETFTKKAESQTFPGYITSVLAYSYNEENYSVFIASYESDQIWALNPSTLEKGWTGTYDGGVNTMTLGTDGSIYVGGAQQSSTSPYYPSRVVKKYSAGDLTVRAVSPNFSNGGEIYGMSVSRIDNSIFVCGGPNASVQKYREDNLHSWQTPSFAQIPDTSISVNYSENVANVAVTDADNYFINKTVYFCTDKYNKVVTKELSNSGLIVLPTWASFVPKNNIHTFLNGRLLTRNRSYIFNPFQYTLTKGDCVLSLDLDTDIYTMENIVTWITSEFIVVEYNKSISNGQHVVELTDKDYPFSKVYNLVFIDGKLISNSDIEIISDYKFTINANSIVEMTIFRRRFDNIMYDTDFKNFADKWTNLLSTMSETEVQTFLNDTLKTITSSENNSRTPDLAERHLFEILYWYVLYGKRELSIGDIAAIRSEIPGVLLSNGRLPISNIRQDYEIARYDLRYQGRREDDR